MMAIEISPSIKNQMLEHATQSFPHECCGFIIGSLGEHNMAIGHYYYPCQNQRLGANQQRRFLIDPLVYQQVEDEADALGLMIVSIVHSHPNHCDLASEFDRKHAWPGISYIIISVFDGRVYSYSSWRLRDDRSEFTADNITIRRVEQ